MSAEVRSLLSSVRRGLVPFVLAIVVASLALPASAKPGSTGSERHRGRAAEVKLARDVRLGQFSEAVVTLWTRCKAPFVVQELVVDLTQFGGGQRVADGGLRDRL
jgi:hypothetical protein